jgi:DNA-binding IclR family transcriptional regulator
VYVACRNGSHGLSLNYRIGMRLPATCTASGKALLATMSDAEVRESFGSALPSLTEHSIISMPELLADLAEARERGYAEDREETRAGMCCIGAPVFHASGRHAIAAVAISLVSVEFESPKRRETVARVKELAGYLSTRLGAAGYVTEN